MGTRDELLDGQRAGRDREAELYGLVTDAPAPPDGEWRAKDHVAHLAAWRRRAAGVLRGPGERVQDIDAWNAAVYDRTRDLPAAEVVQEARDSWDDLVGAIESLSEEQLHAPHPFNPDLELWVVGFTNGSKHLEEHAAYISELRKP